MAKPFAKAFYKSQAWVNCRNAYAASVGGLCEECMKKGLWVPGVIVHHKRPIKTAEDLTQPAITFDWRNLELLCYDCHAEKHSHSVNRYKVDKYGKINGRPEGPPVSE